MPGNTNFDSLWWKTFAVPPRPPLAGPCEADVAIVGAGMTGLTAAVLLARAGRRVVVLEAARIGAGTSGGTSAHVTQVLDHRWRELIDKHGRDGARAVAASTRAALERIAAFVAEERIDCDFARVPGWLYTESDAAADGREIEDELAAAHAAGVAAARDDRPGLPFRVAAAVRFDNQARFHPTRYLAGLAAAAEAAGARVHEATRVRDLQGGTPCRVATERGTVTAGAVVLATHTPAGLSLVQTAIEPVRSYVLALRPGGAAVPDGLFWDTEEPYHYTRFQPGPGGGWLIVGGADHKTGHERLTEGAYHRLEAYVRQRWPRATVAHRWSSQFYEPADGLPFIGPSAVASNVHLATGYSGTGLVLATVAGMLLGDALAPTAHGATAVAAGRRSAWQEVYASRRIRPLAGGAKFVATNLDVAARFIADRLRAPHLADLTAIAPGAARVVEHQGEKLALYREPNGTLHAVAAVCTHLACLVEWNDAERTWDCPCHGSRFTPDGEVLEGPATAPLAPAALLVPAHRG